MVEFLLLRNILNAEMPAPKQTVVSARLPRTDIYIQWFIKPALGSMLNVQLKQNIRTRPGN